MQKNIQNIYLQVKKVADFAEAYSKEYDRMASSTRDYGPIELMNYEGRMNREFALLSLEAGKVIEAEKKLLLEAITRSYAVSGNEVNDDSALFGIPGLKLTIADVREICNRNPNNVLINRLADKWCTENITSISADEIESLHLVSENKKRLAAARIAEDCFYAVSDSSYEKHKRTDYRAINFRDSWDAIFSELIAIIGEV